MSFSATEQAILARYHDKTRTAGGATAGYLMRTDAIAHGVQTTDLEASLTSLAEKGLLQKTEAGDRWMLTEEGVEAVNQAG